MKRGPQQRQKKDLSADGLLKVAKNAFKQSFPLDASSASNPSDAGSSPNTMGRPRTITTVDCLMSAVAMFSLKSPSLYAFDQAIENETVAHNLLNLYGVKTPPSDTYMRERLDEVNPRLLRGAFLDIFETAQRGKLLDDYRFLDGYLLAVDGSQIFSSEKVHCEHCCEKHHHDGRVTYHHNILGAAIVCPGRHTVIPLCPEPITKQDGATKNDCESNAGRRFLDDLKAEHPKLRLTIVWDAIIANAPNINYITSLGYHYIVNVKPGSNRSLFEWIKDLDLRTVKSVDGNVHRQFRYVNNIPLNNTQGAPEVNFLEVIETKIHPKTKEVIKKTTFTYVTDHVIDDNNVYLIMAGGRARWKIENETFNTLKNQGYQFEHNFGHGNKYLHTNFALLMMMAFLIDQIQEAACGLFQAALKTMKTRRTFWERLKSFFHLFRIETWADVFTAIASDFNGPALNTS